MNKPAFACTLACAVAMTVFAASPFAVAQPAPTHPLTDSSAHPPATESPHSAEWGYTGPTGPEHWADLSERYGICSKGQQESPVDLRGEVPARLGALGFDWNSVPLRVTNTGHNIQVDTPTGGALRTADKRYALAQFHIHHPSEHLLNGRRFPLELHFVHKGADGVLGVVGVFVEQGRSNPTLQAVLDAAPRERGVTRVVEGAAVKLSALLPRQSSHYRYEGSLTTPPCSESVDWVVMSQPIQASAEQIKAFSSIYPMNARPVQALNRRFVLRSE